MNQSNRYSKVAPRFACTRERVHASMRSRVCENERARARN